MARPFKKRRICALPGDFEFSPRSSERAQTVELALEEYEAIRLIDCLGLTQEECAAQMSVARTTVQAIYDSARKKLGDVIVNGRRLVIRGGSYSVCERSAGCCGARCPGKRCVNGELRCERCTQSSPACGEESAAAKE